MTTIIVTGTPGTGKTELAKMLAKKLGYRYIDVNETIDQKNLAEKFDTERDTNVVDEKKLSKELTNLIKNKGNFVIDSHMSHCIPAKHVDLCVVTKCELKELKKRLEKKGYKESKVRENMDAEIFDICLNEAEEAGHKLLIIDTTHKKPKELLKYFEK